ncbi:MAG: amidophosphoribosyltransferase [Euryarchaeota archaeon]|jgi:amidophosphoribosyltransferase|nr:amidophosphoribosyltransferase [Euryarchaeota archaeon]MBT5736857.1 amidophosphoribosyltransferase [Euryarchaeota archaeon]MBT7460892.1 amidophosphoribosyltransferase [Euryarchaeota archaeon]
MCGIMGVVGRIGVHVNQLIYDGLTVLQHRGQDAAGIMTDYDGQFRLRKSNGLVSDIFYTRHMQRLEGHIGLGHVRYPTAGSSSKSEAQPFYVNSPYGLSIAHNGNLTNAEELRKDLLDSHFRHMNTKSDSEILLNVLAVELYERSNGISIEGDPHLDVESVFGAIKALNDKVEGGYSCVSLISGYGLLAFRDPNGIRPLVFGKREIEGDLEWIVASESVAITALGFEVVRDVEPGEAIFISSSGHLFTRKCSEPRVHSPCIFEYVYFARPDSVIDGISVYNARLNQGKRLAERILEQWPDHDIDAVIPVPDSGRIAALQMANTLNLPYREGFVKNRYVGRTFIMPGQALREKSVRRKLNAIEHEFSGKNILLVDDSIVRGTTSQQIIEMARDVGANKVYFASAAPPVRYPNVYGIDMPAVNEFIADGRSIEEINKKIGSDRLFYQTLEDLVESILMDTGIEMEFDSSCFDGKYVTGNITEDYLKKLFDKRNDNAKQEDSDEDQGLDLHNDSA